MDEALIYEQKQRNSNPDEAAAERIAAVFVAWNESGQPWAEYVAGLKKASEDTAAAYQIAVTCVPPGGQLPLIPGTAVAAEPKKPRAKKRILMHAVGDRLVCSKCGETIPVPDGMTASARKRGVPCPKCSPATKQGSEAT